MARIAQIYVIEKDVRGTSADERRVARQARSRPLVDALRIFFEHQLTRLSGGSDTARIIRYGLRHWDGLTCFLDDGRIELDTNIVERSMRPQATHESLCNSFSSVCKHWKCVGLTASPRGVWARGRCGNWIIFLAGSGQWGPIAIISRKEIPNVTVAYADDRRHEATRCSLITPAKTDPVRNATLALGKTNVPEFGLLPITESSLYGPARNPWNPDHSPGGSSGGAAVAVAARMVPIAHANDGGGSIRIPAACCGLVGLKPTRARTPLGPQFGDIMSGLVVEHVITRSVRDSAVMLDVAAGPDIGDPYYAPPQPGRYLDAIAVPPPRLRIAFSVLDPFGKEIDPECRAAVTTAANLCANLGHDVEEGHPPVEVGQLASDFMSIWASGPASLIEGIAHLTGKRPTADCFQGLTWSLYQYGRTVSAAQYLMVGPRFRAPHDALPSGTSNTTSG